MLLLGPVSRLTLRFDMLQEGTSQVHNFKNRGDRQHPWILNKVAATLYWLCEEGAELDLRWGRLTPVSSRFRL